jgi:drug/metabolite transporter (DMT)-like permease
MNWHTVALAAGIALTACAHLLLKSGASSRRRWLDSLTHWRTVAGFFLFALVTVLNVYALQEIELRTLVAWSAATYVLVVLASRVALRESLDAGKMVGSLLIAGGIILFSLA